MPFSHFPPSAMTMRRSRASRLALMSAVAALALGAVGGAPLSRAHAETAAISSTTANPNAPSSFADVVDHVKPAVVAIKVKGVAGEEDHEQIAGAPGLPNMSPDDPMFRFFKRFSEQQQGGHGHKHTTMSQGSGFIISPDGYVVTNNHVVDHASDVEVTLDSGKTLPAKVIGVDKRTDLALLKISDSEKLPYVDWSNSNPRIGDWVIAVGNPFGLGGSVTAGIVSARGRDIGAGPYDDFLQIDAPVNRGNSGGPAFDAHGNVIGVNTAIYSPSRGSGGIGFPIPAADAQAGEAELWTQDADFEGLPGVSFRAKRS